MAARNTLNDADLATFERMSQLEDCLVAQDDVRYVMVDTEPPNKIFVQMEIYKGGDYIDLSGSFSVRLLDTPLIMSVAEQIYISLLKSTSGAKLIYLCAGCCSVGKCEQLPFNPPVSGICFKCQYVSADKELQPVLISTHEYERILHPHLTR